jgi:hypothetical protein
MLCDGVISALRPRVASRDSPEAPPSAPKNAVFFNRLASILAASGMKPADPLRPQKRQKPRIKGKIFLIEADYFEDYRFHVIIIAQKIIRSHSRLICF